MTPQTTTLSISEMIAFSRLMLRFQDVLRVVDLSRGLLRENDVEHSYQLAMMGWYLNTAGKLGYDTDRIVQYALVHDLAEAYAGDVHAFDEAARRGKAEREASAIAQIAAEFPGAKDILKSLQAYDARADKEANFIYALDKLMPILMIYIEGGATWRQEGLTLERIHANKADKVALSEPVQRLYDQLRELLAAQPELFRR